MVCATYAGLAASSGVFHDQYTMGEQIGKGHYGKVCTAYAKTGGGAHAVKIMDLRGPTNSEVSQSDLTWAKAEFEIWQRVPRHENVLHLQAAFFQGGFAFFVSELCERSLTEGLPTSGPDETNCPILFRQMLTGIAAVHNAGIVHRDVKPENFLVDGGLVKLADFGLATALPAGGTLTDVVGTPAYMSPEILSRNGYGHATDLWSFGATCYMIVFGCRLHEAASDGTTMRRAIATGLPAPKFEPRNGRAVPSSATAEFIHGFVNRSVEHRLSANDGLGLGYLDFALGPMDWSSSLAVVHTRACEKARGPEEFSEVSTKPSSSLDLGYSTQSRRSDRQAAEEGWRPAMPVSGQGRAPPPAVSGGPGRRPPVFSMPSKPFSKRR